MLVCMILSLRDILSWSLRVVGKNIHITLTLIGEQLYKPVLTYGWQMEAGMFASVWEPYSR